MDHDRKGLAGLAHGAGAAAVPAYDRYAHWPQGLARVAMAILAVLLVLAAWAPGYAPPQPAPPKVTVTDTAGKAHVAQEDDNDLRLYRLIIARVERGDNYYVAATEEQRRNGYPVAPGLTVRLPTLAYLSAWFGPAGMIALQSALFAAMLLANLRRLGSEPGGQRRVALGLALLMCGIASGLNHRYNVLHEIWAAQLIALSFGLHRPAVAPGEPGKWFGALLAAAAALAVRELALPFVLLMAAYAGWHRRWREMAAWAALIAVFVAALLVHLHFAEAQVRPGDPQSPSWLVMGGLSSLLYKVNNSTFFSLLPVQIAGPLVILALFGWTSWRTRMGDFGALLTLGYGAAFMLAGRANNFYWGMMLTPILFMGAAFLPLGLPSLWRAAGPGRTSPRLAGCPA